MTDLRCESKKHGLLISENGQPVALEIKCSSRFCGARRGVVILHRFDIGTGEMIGTVRFKSPNIQKG